jgi:hypothetical protein
MVPGPNRTGDRQPHTTDLQPSLEEIRPWRLAGPTLTDTR